MVLLLAALWLSFSPLVTLCATCVTTDDLPASVVVGQLDFFSATMGTSQTQFNSPQGVAFSSTKLFVSDSSNHRVVRFPGGPGAGGQDAEVVFGQPDFISNGMGTSAQRFNGPEGIFVDASDNLWVCFVLCFELSFNFPLNSFLPQVGDEFNHV